MPIPTYRALLNPLLEAIKRLGRSASIRELNEEVIKALTLTDAELSKPHGSGGTEVEYQLAWARTFLKGYGLIENTGRGIWVLTEKGRVTADIDPREVLLHVREQRRGKGHRRRSALKEITPVEPDIPEVELAEAVLDQSWREQLLKLLTTIPPDAFERLCQRLLRESGFVQVKVTGKSGDGGIDGVGVVRIGGLLGFPVLFQCKRYKGTVSASVIRDFRGAMIGRADRGLVITTGSFSRDAQAEATRDGAPPIDLVDGEQLLDKLKELRLGVNVQMIEEATVVTDWFRKL